MHFFSSYHLEHERKRTKPLVVVSLFFVFSGLIYSAFLYPKFFSPGSLLQKESGLSFDEPVVINFSDAMIPQTFNGKIKIYPQNEVNLHWQDHNRKLVVVPQKNWNPETKYQISLENGRSIMLLKHSAALNFQTKPYPKVSSFSPVSGAQDVLLDIEDPISIVFDNSIKDFKIKVMVDPPAELKSQLDLENNQLKLIPETELDRGANYTFKIAIRGLTEKDENYREIYQSSFRVKPDTPTVWEKDFALRVAQAKQYTECLIEEGKYIDINVKSQVMTIFENGQAQDAYIISSGKRGMDTPQGTFRIANKFPKAWSKKYGLYMPFWMAIVPSGDFGIHELPEWPSGYKEGANHLGTPVSHGCVRLGVGSAERVYNWTEVGTPVIVHS